MITNGQLKCLTEFLDGLSALSEKTGIVITGGIDRPFLDLGDTGFWLVADTSNGKVTYAVDPDDNR